MSLATDEVLLNHLPSGKHIFSEAVFQRRIYIVPIHFLRQPDRWVQAKPCGFTAADSRELIAESRWCAYGTNLI